MVPCKVEHLHPFWMNVYLIAWQKHSQFKGNKTYSPDKLIMIWNSVCRLLPACIFSMKLACNKFALIDQSEDRKMVNFGIWLVKGYILRNWFWMPGQIKFTYHHPKKNRHLKQCSQEKCYQMRGYTVGKIFYTKHNIYFSTIFFF